MEEENILEAIIASGNYRVDFNIKTDFIAEDFSDDRLEKDVKIIETIKECLLFKCYSNTDQITRTITKEFQAMIPKLNLKWKMSFNFI